MRRDSTGISAPFDGFLPEGDGSELEFVAPADYSETQLRERLARASSCAPASQQRTPLKPWAARNATPRA